MKPGSDATLQVWRQGKSLTVTVKIAELKEQEQQAAANTPNSKPNARQTDQATQLGLTVRSLDPSEKEQVQTTGTLVVEEVTGPAAAAGVQPGDIILGINGKKVKTAKELQETAKAGGKNVALLIQRDDAQIFIPLRIQ
jgi:serine protease Do